MKIYAFASVLGYLLVATVATAVSYQGSADSADTNSTTTITTSETSTNLNTTTINGTTTTINGTTTTPEPTNTPQTTEKTTVAPTTPIPPPHVPDPETGSWKLNKSNIICILLDAAIQFEFTYEQGEKNVTTKLNVPTNATVDEVKSSCHSNTIYLTFGENSFALEFEKHDGKVVVKEANLTYVVTNETFPDATNLGNHLSASHDNLTLFEVSAGKAYRCNKTTTFELGHNITASMKNVQIEAYKNNTKSSFSDYEECSGDDKISDIVPIAVGCALAALVVIVLIAYLVGRQRSRQRGYQSV